MNAAQFVLSIAGVALLFIGPMFLRRRLAEAVMFPRSLPALLLTMLFFPSLMLLWIDWMIIVYAAGREPTLWGAVIKGGAALFQPVFGVLFLIAYAFCVLMALVSYYWSRQSERGGRAFAESRGLTFSKDGGAFRLSPSLGATLLQLRNVVTLSPDSFIASFTATVQSPGPRQGAFTFFSLAFGPVASGNPSGTMLMRAVGTVPLQNPTGALLMQGEGDDDDLETIEAHGVTAAAPRKQARDWHALLQALVAGDSQKNSSFGSASVHDSSITLIGGHLAAERDYEHMAALLAAARTHRPPA